MSLNGWRLHESSIIILIETEENDCVMSKSSENKISIHDSMKAAVLVTHSEQLFFNRTHCGPGLVRQITFNSFISTCSHDKDGTLHDPCLLNVLDLSYRAL